MRAVKRAEGVLRADLLQVERQWRKHYNVFFLCTGNSARSIMAEAILNQRASPNLRPTAQAAIRPGTVRPEALSSWRPRIPTEGLRSKSWDEFARPDAPKLDFVFTVCDNAAQEVCPIWPGQPMTAHWGVPDPAAVNGTPEEIERAFREAFSILDRRIGLFLSLPLASIDKLAQERSRENRSAMKSRLGQARSRRISGHGFSGRRRGGFWNHGGAASRRECCSRIAGEYHRYRSCAGGVDSGVWVYFGGAF